MGKYPDQIPILNYRARSRHKLRSSLIDKTAAACLLLSVASALLTVSVTFDYLPIQLKSPWDYLIRFFVLVVLPPLLFLVEIIITFAGNRNAGKTTNQVLLV